MTADVVAAQSRTGERNTEVVTTDFLVIGSGAGGMTAAVVAAELGAKALVIEKTDRYGGTTALSGGGIWIPNNDSMKAAGLQDSEEDAVTYLKKVIGPDVSETKIRAYVREAAKMVRFMGERTPVRFHAAERYADYYPELPGGRKGGRTMDPAPINLSVLGEHFQLMRWPDYLGGFMRFSITMRESREMMDLSLKGSLYMMRNMARYYLDIPARLRGLPDRRLTLGRALVASCRKAMLERDIPLWLNTDAEHLIVENNRVVGVAARKDGKPIIIRASKGVLMAAGGMGQNVAMRQQYGQLPTGETFSSASPADSGDGIRMGLECNAALEFMGCAWWTPSIRLPSGNLQALITGKSMPGSIFVDGHAQRYCNEAAPYEDVTKAQWRNHKVAPSVPSYMIFDARFRHNYMIGTMPPGKLQNDAMIQREYIDSGFMKKAASLRELAALLNLDADALEKTVARHNEFARTGKDLDFGRGDSATDRYYSDVKITPNPNLAPIVAAPFYAVAVYPGDLGTKGGLKCDEFARVLDQNGDVIAGLYATGNCAGSVMGDSYPGAGSTIGPSMTFGYVAAKIALNG
jgi:3-oxosteroid 1-dehydrogenase